MLMLRQTAALTWRNLIVRWPATALGNSKFLSSHDGKDDDSSSSDDEKQPKKQYKIKKEKLEEAEKSTAPISTTAPEKSIPITATRSTANSSPTEQKEETAAERLNRLLVEMPTDDSKIYAMRQQEFPLPGENIRKRQVEAKAAADDKNIFKAAERVAALLGEDKKKQTESELLTRLLGGKYPAKTKSKDGKKLSQSAENDMSLSELIGGMQIDRQQHPNQESRSEYVRRVLITRSDQLEQQQQRDPTDASDRYRPRTTRSAESYGGSVNLKGSEAMGIFKDPSKLRDSPDMLHTWAHLQQYELQLLVTHPPANYFEKIARWTEQGKVWRFPIDNEQDANEEIDVDFSEHIFLEQHLEGWCPNKGPIRHFMELVCVGLSKNPFITAKEKKEHILWYRDYFETKRDMLQTWMNNESKVNADKAKDDAMKLKS